MITVKTIQCNMLCENCHIVSDDSNECVIVDCGCYSDEEWQLLTDYISDNGLLPVMLVATHGHLDHNFGNARVKVRYGLSPIMHPDDISMARNYRQNAEKFYHIYDEFTLPEPEPLAGNSLSFGNHHIQIIHTPGHSKGSVCLYMPDEAVLFSGDTLFHGTIGRTDLYSGNVSQIIQSLDKLSQLPAETVVYTGHGLPTTIAVEVETNPFMIAEKRVSR